MTQSAALLGQLEQTGYRLTTARREVLNAVASRADGFTAEDLARQLPGIGRATVYRTIKLLVETGLLCKMALHDGAPRYSLAGVGHHHHAICVSCGSVSEVRLGAVERALHQLAESTDGRILGHRLEVYITCARCLAQPSRASGPPQHPRGHPQTSLPASQA